MYVVCMTQLSVVVFCECEVVNCFIGNNSRRLKTCTKQSTVMLHGTKIMAVEIA